MGQRRGDEGDKLKDAGKSEGKVIEDRAGYPYPLDVDNREQMGSPEGSKRRRGERMQDGNFF